MEQGSEEWHLARMGKPTGSNFAKVLGSKTVRSGYLDDLICQRLTNNRGNDIRSASIDWGHQNEPFARDLYCETRLCVVEETGFIMHETINAGCSVDGLVDPDGIIEIKCPYNSKNHLQTIESNEVPSQYVAQVQGNMFITGRKWCDYISYDPRFPQRLQLFVVRVEADEDYHETLQEQLIQFCNEIEQRLEVINNTKGEA